ncbi:MAG: hypothetical protein F6J97_20615 [Leptolyngbya sp. SIO4C1]|nr:hypothetical protein [Leptolyngbya sp. SIO4C1]
MVSLIVASIVVSGLLYLVVELLQIDRRETVLDETQRDMRRAMDYVADDLREAIYVYADPAANIATPLDNAGYTLPGGGAIPVLAFWKPQPLDDDFSELPDCSTAANEDTCNALKLRQAYYQLVIYFLKPNTAADAGQWDGKSRIIRYTVSEYTKASLSTAAQTSPFLSNSPAAQDFSSWSPNSAGSLPGTDSKVLVDYVADLDATNGAPTCDTGYTASGISDSFSACILLPETGRNQDVVVFLKGDASGFNDRRLVNSFSEASSLPTLKTQVLVRGVIGKEPD